MNLVFSKNNFDINKINSVLKNFCLTNNIDDEKLLNMQLVSEEFLSNILFPNFENDVELIIDKIDGNVTLSFIYSSAIDFMNKVNETTMISLKILENKTKDITRDSNGEKTIVNFEI